MNNIGSHIIIQKNCLELKQFLIGIIILLYLKINGMIILMKNLKDVMKDFGSITRVFLVILLVLITCTCSGPRLMLGNQTLGSQTGSFIFSGRHASWTPDVTDCVTLRTDVLDFHSWHLQNLYTKQPSLRIPDMGYYRRLERMQRRCLPIRLYPYQSITPFSSNRSRTVWTVPRPNSPIESLPRNSHGENLIRMNVPRTLSGWTPQSTGRTPGTTRMTVRNLRSLPTTNPGNGSVRTTSSIIGVSRKQR